MNTASSAGSGGGGGGGGREGRSSEMISATLCSHAGVPWME